MRSFHSYMQPNQTKRYFFPHLQNLYHHVLSYSFYFYQLQFWASSRMGNTQFLRYLSYF